MWSDSAKYTFKKTADGNITVSARNDAKGGQCGRFVNDYLGIPSFMKDPINVKTSVTNSQTATAGSV